MLSIFSAAFFSLFLDRWKLRLVWRICHTSWIWCCGAVVLLAGRGVARGLRVFLHLEWSALLISDVNLFPRSSQGSISLPQICSGVDLPACSAVASRVAPGLFFPTPSTWLTFSLCSHFCRNRKRKRRMRSQNKRTSTDRHIYKCTNFHLLVSEGCKDTEEVPVNL